MLSLYALPPLSCISLLMFLSYHSSFQSILLFVTFFLLLLSFFFCLLFIPLSSYFLFHPSSCLSFPFLCSFSYQVSSPSFLSFKSPLALSSFISPVAFFSIDTQSVVTFLLYLVFFSSFHIFLFLYFLFWCIPQSLSPRLASRFLSLSFTHSLNCHFLSFHSVLQFFRLCLSSCFSFL